MRSPISTYINHELNLAFLRLRADSWLVLWGILQARAEMRSDGVKMKTIEVRIPEPVFRQAQDLAALEDITLDHLLSLALTQMISMWSTERQMTSDAKSNSRRQFLEMLQHALDNEKPGLKRVSLPR